jgi:hypothetical protein
MESLVDILALEQVLFQVLQFSPASYQFSHLLSGDGTICPLALSLNQEYKILAKNGRLF